MKTADVTIKQKKRGFTLVEIMIVLTIMAVIMGIFTVVIGNVLNSGRETQTRATLKKIDELVQDRLRAFRLAKERGRFQGTIQDLSRNWSSGPNYKDDLISVCVHKHYMGKYFGMDYLLDPSSYNDPVNGANAVGTSAEEAAFSSEILYELLMKGTIAGENPVPLLSITAAETDFSSNEIGDTDGDGRLEFLDGWGNPLRMYLWPTFLTRPDGTNLIGGNLLLRLYIPAAADKPDNVLETDPDDPKGILSQATASELGVLNSAGVFAFTFDDAVTPPEPHHFDTYHTMVVVSAGQDQTLGVKEPLESILAEPELVFGGFTFDPAQTDSTSADHIYNSPINDDITNHQGTRGN
ncbi:hypothetical protein Pla110_35590 [Polystyrenella longa]|uniref:Type II secretion system protein G n=1 Tax=Polystyrenella longa TaxID=2528007 RepID=A0A518CRF8_9PLAN|nr:type II secretion system protein [Polystyrenella longa]QDU81809.1 hypothetical protein Pla110_35590 [Polystyrenella longa]